MSDERRGDGRSYLVRLWREPRGSAAGEPPTRIYVRELRSGEERYLKDVAALADYLDHPRPSRTSGADRAAAGGRRAG